MLGHLDASGECSSCQQMMAGKLGRRWGYRGGNPALCGSHPLVTPYYCRLGDLLYLFVYPLSVYYFVCVCICVFCVFLGCFPL